MSSELAALVARLEILEAERAIRRTLDQYGHTIGRGDEAGWLDCFTDAAVFDIRRRIGSAEGQPTHPHPDVRGGGAKPSIKYSGRAELANFISRHPRPPGRYHKHIVVDPVIDVTGETAAVVSFFMRLDAAPDITPHLTAFGRYIDRMQRCADGRWRFLERIAEVESRGPDPG
jgi:hypothetical protein